jgi:signal transduction histidine kinase
MLSSLRFRLPALFLLGIVVSGVIAAAVALALFQNYARQQLLVKLRHEADGLTALYQKQAIAANNTGARTLRFAPAQLEKATGDKIFYVGADVFPDQVSGLRQLPQNSVDWRSGEKKTFEFRPPGFKRKYLAVLQPMRLAPGSSPFGALVVATPTAEITSRLEPLGKRLGLAFIGGILIAGLLGWYLSRRITQPVLALSEATDEISRGHYDVTVPAARGGGEIRHLAQRFREMAKRLSDAEQQERNFLMSVSHELRTPLTAIRGHVDALEAHRFTLLTEEVDMERLCEQAYAAFGEEARRRGIDYAKRFDARPTIVSDGDRVLQIISNLLSNAFRWTPDGGRVELELAASNGRVSVAVDDNGPGVPAEERDRIFRPFWSRDDSGTGLGLAIAHELAVALGGSIRLQSEHGRGSRFELVLPAERN